MFAASHGVAVVLPLPSFPRNLSAARYCDLMQAGSTPSLQPRFFRFALAALRLPPGALSSLLFPVCDEVFQERVSMLISSLGWDVLLCNMNGVRCAFVVETARTRPGSA